MTEWWWVVQHPQKNLISNFREEPTYWLATINSDPYAGGFTQIQVSRCDSREIGRLIISAVKEVNPLQAQLYKLVYGSLP